jgi:hypothetical protein
VDRQRMTTTGRPGHCHRGRQAREENGNYH